MVYKIKCYKVAKDLFKTLALYRIQLSEDLQLNEKKSTSKKDHISRNHQQAYRLKYFKDFPNHISNTNRAVVFKCWPFAAFLNTGTLDEVLQQFGRRYSFRHILRSSTSLYESSDSKPQPDYNQDLKSFMKQDWLLVITRVLQEYYALSQ